ncbi:MAG: hypothetical protein C4542_07305 [Dehalococcoidia bacterium]|nr:MAG: hypothetical protein C4542_07305 [Dehalococcoidia bacterium]
MLILGLFIGFFLGLATCYNLMKGKCNRCERYNRGVWTMRRTKSQCQMLHARKRVAQRYGKALSSDAIKRIARLIKTNNDSCAFIERQSLRVTVWDVPYEGQTYRVVYDNKRHSIVTFLPPDIKVKRPHWMSDLFEP